jgi:imidazolonepropionase-like amidohydrolase
MQRGSLALGFLLAAATVRPAVAADALAIVGATVVASPAARPLPDGVVLVENGRIAAVGSRADVPVPAGTRRLEAQGLTLVAGFWNCHVHFTGPEWQPAATRPRAELAQAMERMLTRYGFTSVVDASSFLPNTLALRERVEREEVPGPRILTTGSGLYPPEGVPIYLREALPPDVVAHLPQPGTPAEARRYVEASLAGGADATKLFVSTWLGGDATALMALEVVKAASEVTHRAGKQVLVHPGTRAGVLRALEGGVDVLMHTTPVSGPWEPALVSRLVAAQLALVPTLGLWSVEGRKAHLGAAKLEAFVQAGVGQLRAFAAGGGEVLFGTDVGYHDAVDTGEELVRMAQAGLGWREILAALTTAPARRFGGSGTGTIAPGEPADLVLLQGEPVRDPRALGHVALTLRKGRVLYRAPN